MKRLMIVGAGYGDGLRGTYDFDENLEPMTEEHLVRVLREKHVITRHKVRWREKLKHWELPGWEILDGGGKPIYVAFVATGDV